MNYLERDITKRLLSIINRGKSILLLGPRQTGKTTLMQHLQFDLLLSLADVRIRIRYEKNPGALANEIEALAETKRKLPLVIVDEIQKIPLLMDVVQDLIDRKVAQFILTGSSARKLRMGETINLLPGRVISLHMDPLCIHEIPKRDRALMNLLLYGSLPEVILTKGVEEKEELLDSYVTTYLEEEIRAEALVRNVGHFARFLEIAAAESGNPINLNKLSQEIGVVHNTIASYYEILEDCLVAERIEPITQSKSRRKLTKAQKYLIFDLGVRRLAAREGVRPPKTYLGHLFEQFIGLELIRIARLQTNRTQIRYWRDPNGPEVDWVVEKEGQYLPIEVKWTDSPTVKDARHLQTFLDEYPEETDEGFVICQTPRKMKLADRLYALPWQEMGNLLSFQ